MVQLSGRFMGLSVITVLAILVGRSMFYWVGRAYCIEPHERTAWEDWVALELQFGNSEDNFNVMLYGLDPRSGFG
jgi:hypothetical protein